LADENTERENEQDQHVEIIRKLQSLWLPVEKPTARNQCQRADDAQTL